jgi:hypothetical protein
MYLGCRITILIQLAISIELHLEYYTLSNF